MRSHDVIVVGGGPAGLAAACAAAEAGAKDILVLEREAVAGGILNQCIHDGFGLHRYGEALTGPEYAERDVTALAATSARLETEATALSLTPARTLTYVSPTSGCAVVTAKALVLATGCRERTRGQLRMPGTRPAGVLTAGAAQRYLNIDGFHVGRRVIILGSGDIGLIMARRLTLEGAKVVAVVEVMPYSSGLTRNRVQCLDDFSIPLWLSHTVVRVLGSRRVEGVVVAEVDEARRPRPGTERTYAVDTLLLSVGLIPENEVALSGGVALDKRTRGPIVDETLATSVPGVFACGNAVSVHDIVDFVSAEGRRAGRAAARFAAASDSCVSAPAVRLTATGDVAFVVPQRVTHRDDPVQLSFRVRRPYLNGGAVTLMTARGAVIAERVYERLSPGERATLTVTPQAMAAVASDESETWSLAVTEVVR